MVIQITTTDLIVVILIHGIITSVIIGTNIHVNTIMADTIIITTNPEAITNTDASTDITIDPINITRNQDISTGTITTEIITQAHLMVTRHILPLASTRGILTLCYATDMLLGETQRQTHNVSPLYFFLSDAPGHLR